ANHHVSTLMTTVDPRADLTVSATGPANGNEGDTFTYNITVTNNGPSDAANVVLTDVLPANVSFQSISGFGGASASQSGQTVTINIGAVAANGTSTGTIVVKATNDGIATEALSVSSDTPDPVSNNN